MNDSEDAENELQSIIEKDAKKIYIGFNTVSKIRIRETYFSPIKDHVVDSLHKLQQRIKEVKDLLKKLKDENTRILVQLGEKDEEIDRMKDEANQQEAVTNDAHLESQLEEARRKEEVLKDQLEKKDKALERQLERARWKEEDLKEQLEEKDKAYQKLEAEVVELKKRCC